MWHGEVEAYFEVISWHCAAGFQQYHEKPSFSIAVPCAHTCIRNFPITTQGCCAADSKIPLSLGNVWRKMVELDFKYENGHFIGTDSQ
jgi:hypothetical protein